MGYEYLWVRVVGVWGDSMYSYSHPKEDMENMHITKKDLLFNSIAFLVSLNGVITVFKKDFYM